MDREVGRFSPAAAALAVAGSLLGYTTAPASAAQPASRYSVVELPGVAQQINNSGQVAGCALAGAVGYPSSDPTTARAAAAGENRPTLRSIEDLLFEPRSAAP